MKSVIFIFLLVSSSFVMAQDKVGVIAVGEAGEEVDKVCLI